MSTIGSLALPRMTGAIVRRFRVGGSMGAGADGGNSNDRTGHDSSSGGGSGGSHGGSSGSGAYNGQGRPNTPAKATAASGAFSGQGGAGPMSGSGNAAIADKHIQETYSADPNEGVPTERDYWHAVDNLGQRANDFANRGNTAADTFGNFLAELVGVGEMDPTKQALGASIGKPTASWGVDPADLATTIGGLVTGLPINTIYKGVKSATGYTGPMVAFDGNQYGDYGFNSSPIAQGNGVTSDSAYDGDAPGGPSSGASSGAAPGNLGKGNGSGSIGSLQPTIYVPVTPATQTPTSHADDSADDDSPDPTTPVQPGMVPYPYDPLHYGETAGGWNFWPDGHPVAAADGGSIRGAGDGQSDEIPALLSNNEHVIDAMTVAAAGRGDSEAGHRAIEKWKQDVRKRAGMKNAKKAPLMNSIGSLARAA